LLAEKRTDVPSGGPEDRRSAPRSL
jgi:hypothetical protein